MTATFGFETTSDEVLAGVDLRGRRVLITGVSAGLGVETARALVARGAEVIGAVRDIPKAKQATDGVVQAVEGGGGLSLVELDLADLASVRGAADALVEDGRPFDLIIANAGVMATPHSSTVDGFERQFGTNHLGHFVLVNRLAGLLRQGARVVNVASLGHAFSDVDLNDPNFERTPYDEAVAYGRSKTANILFAVEFDNRHRARGVRATAVHPGTIRTELGRYMTPEVRQRLVHSVQAQAEASGASSWWKTAAQGAATTLWAGVVAQADEVGGRYCEDCHVAALYHGDAVVDGVRPYALDPVRALALWGLSETLVGERF